MKKEITLGDKLEELQDFIDKDYETRFFEFLQDMLTDSPDYAERVFEELKKRLSAAAVANLACDLLVCASEDRILSIEVEKRTTSDEDSDFEPIVSSGTIDCADIGFYSFIQDDKTDRTYCLNVKPK